MLSEARLSVKARIIAGLAVIWRFIFWAWSILILGVISGVLGNIAFTYLTTGKVAFKDLRTLTVVAWLNANLALCVTLLASILAITLCSYLAHRWQQRSTKLLAPLTSTPSVESVNREIIPSETTKSKIGPFEGKTDRLPSSAVEGNSHKDWGGAPDVPIFFGRTEELDTLE